MSEFLQIDGGGILEIPPAIIATSKTDHVQAPHTNPELAEKGVKITRLRRTGVEAYIAATPTQRAAMLHAARVELGEIEVEKSENDADVPAATPITSVLP